MEPAAGHTNVSEELAFYRATAFLQRAVLPKPFCPSVKQVDCGKTKDTCAHIIIPHERLLILVFWQRIDSGVTRVGVTRGQRVSPFFIKKLRTFFSHRHLQSDKKWWPFLAVVSSQLPPSDVVCPVFVLNSAPNFFTRVVDGVTRGGQPPSDATENS